MSDAAISQLPSLPYSIVVDTDDEAEWLAHRHSGLGASEIAGVLALPGISRRSSPLRVYCEKTGALEPEDLSDIEAIEWGHRLEPVIARAFEQRTGREVLTGRRGRFQVLRSTEHPWAMCSLDFWTALPGQARHPLEIKNVSAFMADDWSEGVPDYYYAQVQQQMLITGAELATAACLLGGNRLAWCDVPRDEVMIRRIVFHGALMWDRVLQRQPPDPDGSDATKYVLHKLFAQDDGTTAELPAELLETVEKWRALKAEIKQRETAVQHCEAIIKATLGHAQVGVFAASQARISWKTQQVKEHTVKAGTKRPLLFHPPRDR